MSLPTNEEMNAIPPEVAAPDDGPADGEPERAPRTRRRRGRRGSAERPESRAEEGAAGEIDQAIDANSAIDVEPELAVAQQVEHVGAPPREVAVTADAMEADGVPAAIVYPEPELPPAQPRGDGPREEPRQRTAGYAPGQSQGQRGRPPVAGRPVQAPRTGRPQSLPPGVPSAAALDEVEPARPVAPARPEPQGDLALLLRGFEEIQQRNTDRLLSAMRQGGAPGVSGDGVPSPRTLTAIERVGVFVDVPNLVYAARYLNRWIDFGRLLERLLSGRRLIRAHAYSPTDPDPSAEQQFLTPVKSQGYRLTTKNYRTFASGAKKADMDLDLCMDVVRLVVAKAVDCIVLCSGDGDFLPMLDFCSDNGVRVEVASFIEATSDELRQACDRFYNVSVMEGIRLARPLGSGG